MHEQIYEQEKRALKEKRALATKYADKFIGEIREIKTNGTLQQFNALWNRNAKAVNALESSFSDIHLQVLREYDAAFTHLMNQPPELDDIPY